MQRGAKRKSVSDPTVSSQARMESAAVAMAAAVAAAMAAAPPVDVANAGPPKALAAPTALPESVTAPPRGRDVAIYPTDVIFGCRSSGAPKDHPGNIVFHGLVAARKEEYSGKSIGRRGKSQIAEDIVDAVEGRFLRKNDGKSSAFVVVDRATALNLYTPSYGAVKVDVVVS